MFSRDVFAEEKAFKYGQRVHTNQQKSQRYSNIFKTTKKIRKKT